MFEKVNVKVKICGPTRGETTVLIIQVVTVTCIGLTAGAFPGTRDTRDTTTTTATKATTTALCANDLLKTTLALIGG